jgi:hypothetical protein
VAGQVKDHGVGALTALISGGAVALIGEIFKNAVTEGLKSGGVAFWLTIIAAALAMIVAYISSYNYSVIFRDYGLDSADNDERAVFDGLRARLAAGGRFIPIYNDLLTRGLDRVDRFFGDADPRVKTLWPRAFGFKGAKPFWTAPAYDRCLIIALLYPLVVLLVVWCVSGQVSKAAAAMLLSEGVIWWKRALLGFVLIVLLCSGHIASKEDGKFRQFFGFSLLCTIVTGIASFVFDGAVDFVFKIVIFMNIIVIIFDRWTESFYFCLSLAVLISIVMFITSVGSGYNMDVSFFIIFSSVWVVGFINHRAHTSGGLGYFFTAFSIFYFVICYAMAFWFGGENSWERTGPLFLFFGVLTLINAPFDWLSIGLTRALLRRGVEAEGFAPVWLALLDLVFATLLIVVLAIVTVVAVDLFEVVGRSKFIDVAGVLDALADPVQRRDTQYWWIYATLFSTLIPSVLNMTVAALSLMRGVPWFHKRVAAAMRPGKPMMDIHLSWMPGALALEVMLAAMAGLAFTYWWIFKAVPWLTRPVEWLIPMLRWVAGLV